MADDPMAQRIAELEAENAKLKEELAAKDKSLKFLSEEQTKYAAVDRKSIHHWSHKSITNALKLRFAVGKFGYKYLRKTGYPSPAYSTLNRRMQGINVDFGILHSIIHAMRNKVSYMSESDRWCALNVDEMEISTVKDFDTSEKKFIGGVTLGAKDAPGKHYTVVLARGLKAKWKQVIAHEITGPSTSGQDMHNLMSRCILASQSIGLVAKAVVSDMGSSNKGMWREFKVGVKKDERCTSFNFNGSNAIHVIADVPHLIKNLRTATLATSFILPQSVCEREGLVSRHVSSGCIKHLWQEEIDGNTSIRSFHHLRKEHLYPDNRQKMNVGTAVQFFSKTTAGAIEKAVRLEKLNKECLTTAFWIRLIDDWFTIMTSRSLETSITLSNRERKFEYLRDVVDIVQNTQFGAGWKPLQTGIIMSTLSVIKLAEEAFEAGFKFFMPGRLSQDALENVFSQVRRKAGKKPTALRARMALKLICVSQFIADLKGTNYAPDNDFHLFDLADNDVSQCNKSIASMSTSSSTEFATSSNDIVNCVAAAPSIASTSSYTPLSTSLNNTVNCVAATTNIASTSPYKPLTLSEENDVYYMAGATLNGILKQKLCDACVQCVKTVIDPNEPNLPKEITFLNEYLDKGGLKWPTTGIYRICRETERLVQHNKDEWVKNEIAITDEDINIVIDKCKYVQMPNCCNIKERIIKYYLIIRCKGIQNHLQTKAGSSHIYSSPSAFKKS